MKTTNDKKEILEKIVKYKKRIDDIDTNISLFLSDKTKYPHPGHESFIMEVRRFENKVHTYPNKDVQYFLDNLMDSLMIHERIWKQKFINYENKRKNLFTEDEIKSIYSSFVSKRKERGLDDKTDYHQFRIKFNKAVELKSENIASNEKLKVVFSKKTGEVLLKKEKIVQF